MKDDLTYFGSESPKQEWENALNDMEWLSFWMADRGKAGDEKQENPEIPAGYTYLGQLITHDMTLNARSLIPVPDGHPEPPLRNANTPALDLDMIYRGGPEVSPILYEPLEEKDSPRRRVKLRLGLTQPETDTEKQTLDDLPRACVNDVFDTKLPICAQNAKALRFESLIGDERNQDNLILAQLLVQFHKLHNKFVDIVERSRTTESPREIFHAARWLTVETYHRIIKTDFLKRLLDEKIYAEYEAKGKIDHFQFAKEFIAGEPPGLPVEFTMAAMRVGHAMVREHYPVGPERNPPNGDPSIGFLMKFNDDEKSNSRKIPITSAWRVTDWNVFFPGETGHANQVSSRLLRPAAASSLVNDALRFPSRDDQGQGTSNERPDRGGLIFRDLARSLMNGLPTGHVFAQALDTPKGERIKKERLRVLLDDAVEFPQFIKISENAVGKPDIKRIADRPPLFFYVLAEAELERDGRKLGFVGSKIMAEVIFSVLLLSSWAEGEIPPAAESAAKSMELPSHMSDLIEFTKDETENNSLVA